MFTVKYWKDAIERVIATAAAVIIGSGVVVDFGSKEFWQIVGATTGLTLLKVLAATQVGANNTAAMLTEEADTERGYTLVELLVGVFFGILILIAFAMLLDRI